MCWHSFTLKGLLGFPPSEYERSGLICGGRRVGLLPIDFAGS
jgi:hypothetical protein